MYEISDINQLINQRVSFIDTQIRLFERQIKNQGNYFDWAKPNIETAKKSIAKLLTEREFEARIIIKETKIRIEELSKIFGDSYFVCYTKHIYIGIHRENCEFYKDCIRGAVDVGFKNSISFADSLTSASKLTRKMQTDISDDCQLCLPYWNLIELKNSLISSSV